MQSPLRQGLRTSVEAVSAKEILQAVLSSKQKRLGGSRCIPISRGKDKLGTLAQYFDKAISVYKIFKFGKDH